MKFTNMKLDGVYAIDIEKVEDERGFFARTWDKDIFTELGLDSEIVQCDISYNKKKGTLRGLHYQREPYGEGKIVRCTKGRVYQVILDIRKDSKTFLEWESIELSENIYKMLFIPKGFALGFQTLEDETEIFYQMTQKYMPEYAMGIRWDDPKLNIKWPIKPTVISQKDQSWKLL